MHLLREVRSDNAAMRWDLFCRVIDNHGDAGVCWRLAADLAARGEQVRLWIDDRSMLVWMAPDGAAGVQVRDWPREPEPSSDIGGVEPGDVVIEAFGCELPEWFVRRMAASSSASTSTSRVRPPVWINLEYLSAESFVERNHKLLSPPSSGAASGLRKWFFYPGFTTQTGGLLREANLLERQRTFNAHDWLIANNAAPRAGEKIVSLFCYEQPALHAMLDVWSRQPTLLLATSGLAGRQVEALLGPGMQRGLLRAVHLPLMPQTDYDQLLWASDINFVRGEDSFVRAQWAGKPFVWHIYPQVDNAHRPKLDAFLDRYVAAADAGMAASIRRFWHAWNSNVQAPTSMLEFPAIDDWARHALAWRDLLARQADLTTQLIGFALESG
jgi:uncharacterized repeat protein (TIGR03837 family)